MRDYKWRKGLGVIALCGLGGAILGSGMQILMNRSEPTAISVCSKPLLDCISMWHYWNGGIFLF